MAWHEGKVCSIHRRLRVRGHSCSFGCRRKQNTFTFTFVSMPTQLLVPQKRYVPTCHYKRGSCTCFQIYPTSASSKYGPTLKTAYVDFCRRPQYPSRCKSQFQDSKQYILLDQTCVRFLSVLLGHSSRVIRHFILHACQITNTQPPTQILSRHEVQLNPSVTGHSPVLSGQCKMSDCYFQPCIHTLSKR